MSGTIDGDGRGTTSRPRSETRGSALRELLKERTERGARQLERHMSPATLAASYKFSASIARSVVASFAPRAGHESDHALVVQRLWVKGWVFIAIFFGLFALWGTVVSISGAVVGSGQFVVDSSAKKVQHPTGGIVGDLRVREGSFVQEGEILLRLDETTIRANLQVVVKQLDELFGRTARLLAERDGRAALVPSPELSERLSDPHVARIFDEEVRLFEARRSARDGQKAQLKKRIAQLQNEIGGLRSQLDANAREATIIADELKGVRELYAKNLVSISRLTQLQRQAVSLDGQRGQLLASTAQTEGRIGEIELQLLQIEDDLRATSQKELREDGAKIAELTERRIAAEDQLKRVELRAPSTGYVHQLAAHTVGGVITAAEPVMLIVPVHDELFVEARVTPRDRDQLRVGQPARVRISSANARTTPELGGALTRISADVSKDPNAPATFYSVRIAVPNSEFARLPERVAAGMQAEIFIEAGSRTPIQYLLKPLQDQIARAFREK